MENLRGESHIYFCTHYVIMTQRTGPSQNSKRVKTVGELRDATNIHWSFFIKNHYWNLKLSVVALSSVLQKESPKRCEPPKNNKNSSHGKRYKKDIESGKKSNMKSIRRV